MHGDIQKILTQWVSLWLWKNGVTERSTSVANLTERRHNRNLAMRCVLIGAQRSCRLGVVHVSALAVPFLTCCFRSSADVNCRVLLDDVLVFLRHCDASNLFALLRAAFSRWKAITAADSAEAQLGWARPSGSLIPRTGHPHPKSWLGSFAADSHTVYIWHSKACSAVVRGCRTPVSFFTAMLLACFANSFQQCATAPLDAGPTDVHDHSSVLFFALRG